ncbi:FBP1 protein, partial [Psilopogon haemacephalus]|nr:FBP1 protein [Psilopogon haemacephalus]
GALCEEPADPCASQPCPTGSTCQHHQDGYLCACPAGFLGHHCEIALSGCSSGPCQNRGTCIDLPNVSDVACACLPVFTGKFCEAVLDPCEMSPCLNNATCLSGNFVFPTPGEPCEVQIGRCDPRPCAGGGTCVDYGEHFKCSCPPGESLELCCFLNGTQKMSPKDCANGGSCFSEAAERRALCVCARGWAGQRCLEDISACAEHQCQHGATCEDGLNEYSCSCAPAYEGPFCQAQTDECSSSPCQNGAACVDLLGHFSCRCAAGFKGGTCSLPVGHCPDRPCWNGGTCEEHLNGFRCNCSLGESSELGFDCSLEAEQCASLCCDFFFSQGFEGLNCEINFDECTFGFCKGNSTCLDLVADYSCVCPPGFTGK